MAERLKRVLIVTLAANGDMHLYLDHQLTSEACDPGGAAEAT